MGLVCVSGIDSMDYGQYDKCCILNVQRLRTSTTVCSTLLAAAPHHRPRTPSPAVNARAVCSGNPRTYATIKPMIAPSVCLPAPRNTPPSTVLTPSPAQERD